MKFSVTETLPQPQAPVSDPGSRKLAQAPILQHFHLQLVHGKQLTKEDACMVSFLVSCTIYTMAPKSTTALSTMKATRVHNKLPRGDHDVTEDFGRTRFDRHVSLLKKRDQDV